MLAATSWSSVERGTPFRASRMARFRFAREYFRAGAKRRHRWHGAGVAMRVVKVVEAKAVKNAHD
jgi:hypothetical protein